MHVLTSSTNLLSSYQMNLAFIAGAAGTGKTTWLKTRLEANPSFGVLCATTGIAAINLGNASGPQPTTINSLLGYYDQESMEEAYEEGWLRSNLIKVSRMGLNLIPDEVSMMSKETLEVLHMALEDANSLQTIQDRGGLGLILTGDFCQLAPINASYAFEARCWDKWERSPIIDGDDAMRPSGIIKLTKNYRQSDPNFIKLLQAARAGHGAKTAEMASAFNMLVPVRDRDFDGVTIFAKNDKVRQHNKMRLLKLIREGAEAKTIRSFRWGRQKPEWKFIPEEDITCMGAYTMVLSNDSPLLSYANGDCGHIIDWKGEEPLVKLSRVGGPSRGDGREITARKITRQNTIKPNATMPVPVVAPLDRHGYQEMLREVDRGNILEGHAEALAVSATYKQYLRDFTMTERARLGSPTQPFYDWEKRRWVVGEITYVPIRAAYASTVHKVQGLTLDRVQIDAGDGFFGMPAMMYVAMSRVRGPEGLTIVGDERSIESRTNVAEEVLRWV